MPTGSDRMGSISRYELLMYLQLFVIDSSIYKTILISKFFVFSEIGFFPIFQIPVFLPIFVNRDFLVSVLRNYHFQMHQSFLINYHLNPSISLNFTPFHSSLLASRFSFDTTKKTNTRIENNYFKLLYTICSNTI